MRKFQSQREREPIPGNDQRFSRYSVKRCTMRLLLTLWIVGSVIISNAQGYSQTFPEAGFRVKCSCELRTNSLYIDMAEQLKIRNVIAAYICAENENSPETGVVVNINVYDESQSYRDIKPEYHAYFEKRCLEQYAANLEEAGISYKYISYQGVNAVEYDYYMVELPARAIYFFKDKKSYLLQVGTRNNLAPKFQALKSSFELL